MIPDDMIPDDMIPNDLTSSDPNTTEPIRFRVVDSPVGPLTIAGRNGRVSHLRMDDQRHPPGDREAWEHDPHGFADVAEQLAAYFAGDKRQFGVRSLVVTGATLASVASTGRANSGTVAGLPSINANTATLAAIALPATPRQIRLEPCVCRSAMPSSASITSRTRAQKSTGANVPC